MLYTWVSLTGRRRGEELVEVRLVPLLKLPQLLQDAYGCGLGIVVQPVDLLIAQCCHLALHVTYVCSVN